jgi:hypothetical protein
MTVFVSFALSGRGLCDGPITRPEESYRTCCIVVCDLKTSSMRRPWPVLARSTNKITPSVSVQWIITKS